MKIEVVQLSQNMDIPFLPTSSKERLRYKGLKLAVKVDDIWRASLIILYGKKENTGYIEYSWNDGTKMGQRIFHRIYHVCKIALKGYTIFFHTDRVIWSKKHSTRIKDKFYKFEVV